MTGTGPWVFAEPDQPADAYLVIHPDGGPPQWAGLDADRAHELARNTGCVVARIPVTADSRPHHREPLEPR